MEVDAKNTQLIDEHEHVNQIDLNIEDFGSDFNNEVFQDGQDDIESIQSADQNVQENNDQNVQAIVAQNVQEATNPFENVPNEPVEQMSADPNPMASGSMPLVQVQLVQPTQDVEPAQNINVSTSTIGSIADVSKYLVSHLMTPNTVPLSPPPITNKSTKKLPDIPDLFCFW